MNELLVIFCIVVLIIASIFGFSFFYKDIKKINQMWEDETFSQNKKSNGK